MACPNRRQSVPVGQGRDASPSRLVAADRREGSRRAPLEELDRAAGRALDHLAELDRERVGPIARAVEPRADDALRIDDPGLWEELRAVLARHDVALRIEENVERHV